MSVTAGAGRPKGGYKIGNDRVPGTTTIIDRFKESGGLMYWAWQQGIAGKDYRDTSGSAAAAGSITHARIEAKILNQEGPELFLVPSAELMGITEAEHTELVDRSNVAMSAFNRWFESARVEVLHTELPLLSQQLRFGGTIDAIAKIEDELVVLDWKTSNKVYGEYIVQLAAYRHLWNEHNPDQLIHAAYLLRADKNLGNFSYHYWPRQVLDVGMECFMLLRRLYDLEKQLKKAVG